MDAEWLPSAPPAPVLTGSERFIGCDAAVADFWAFAMSDLRMNNVRGYLAEFLVARAVGATGSRIEWDSYDVKSPDNIRIEVKSSAHLQVWDQRDLSRIVFTGLQGRTWTPREGESPEATFNADVYVFCVHTATSHAMYDPLDVRQWQFHVVPRDALTRLGYKTISLAALLRITDGPVEFDDLAHAIKEAGTTAMTHCEICDLPISQCPHGRAEVARNAGASVREILVSPNGIAHFPGCPHKADDEDYSRWGVIESENVWSRLGNGEPIKVTGGASTELVATGRCSTCVEFGPW